MKKIKKFNYLSEVFITLFTLSIIILFLIPNVVFPYFSYFSFQISIRNIIATLFFIFIMILKNTKKVNMMIFLNRFDIRELIFSYSYYVSTFSLFLLALYMHYINFIFALIIICLEVLIIVTNYYSVYTNSLTRELVKYIRIKEITYACMMMLLLLNNFPFEVYSIPMDVVLVIMYIVVQCNVIYKMYK